MMSACVDNFMKNVDSAFKNSAQCGIHDCYRALTLDTICKVGLGVDFKIQDDHKNSTYLRQAEVLLSLPLDWVVVIASECSSEALLRRYYATLSAFCSIFPKTGILRSVVPDTDRSAR